MNSSTNIHSLAYTVTLMLLAASIPLSKFTMSITEFMLLGLWLWSGFSFSISYRFFKLGGFFTGLAHLIGYIFSLAYNNVIDKFSMLYRNKPVMVFLLIYIIHILGLFYTTDFSYAIKDLRVKVPLLLLPVVIATMGKINSKQLKILLVVYSLSVLISTIISGIVYLTNNVVDIREISTFISPIRMGLNISFAFFIMIYFIFHDKKNESWQIVAYILVAIWFLFFLFLLESITSIVIILIVGVGYLFMRVYHSLFLRQKIMILIIAILLPLFFGWFVNNIVVDATRAPKVEFSSLDKLTNQGNKYIHDTINFKVEDGKYVGLYICYDELLSEWNKRSNIDYNGHTTEGQFISATLIRYLTSKDLRKDFDGVKSLSDEDISLVEQGLANYNYVDKPGLRTRILKIIKGYEVYKETRNPSGSSVMQRIEYIRASFKIIEQNLIFGVGTGDLEGALYDQFSNMNSALETKYRYHTHNQFVSAFVAFGLFGFLVFVFGLFYPVIALQGFKDYFFSVFFFIMFISMFSDDTFETQAGVTLFAFFYTLLLFGRKKGDQMPASISD